MKTKKTIKKFVNNEVANIRQIISSEEQTHLPDEIHRLRVSIKKLKSVLAVAKVQESRKKVAKKSKPVRKLFNAAGRLRDLQLRAHTIQEHNAKSELSHYLYFLN